MTRAVIQAGGKGTRLYPYTAVLPKPLMPIGEAPILEIVVRQLLDGFAARDRVLDDRRIVQRPPRAHAIQRQRAFSGEVHQLLRNALGPGPPSQERRPGWARARDRSSSDAMLCIGRNAST